MSDTEYAKQTRQIVIVGNWSALIIIVAAVLALVWFAPPNDVTNVAMGLLGTIAGMVVKNTSTVVDCVFGGSDSNGSR